jgi:hypothetical protein
MCCEGGVKIISWPTPSLPEEDISPEIENALNFRARWIYF